MKIYEVEAQAKNGNYVYATLMFSKDLENTENDCNFKGVRQGERWVSPEFEWQYENDISKGLRERANFAYVFSGGINLAADARTKAILSDQFGENLEFLPINIKDENNEWFLINIINVIEKALSLESSEFKLRSNGTFGRLTKAVFCLDNIPNNCPFVYRQWINAFMFKGEKFKKVLSDNKLKGLEFDECSSI